MARNNQRRLEVVAAESIMCSPHPRYRTLPRSLTRERAAPLILAAALAASILYASNVWAREYVIPSPPNSVVGQVITVRTSAQDTLSDIARRYEVGYDQIRLANPGVDPWMPGAGTKVVVPSRFVLPDAPRRGIVINVPEMRLYYYPRRKAGQPAHVFTYPVSIGRGDWQTPLVVTKIVRKEPHPVWIPPKSIRAEHAANGDPLPKVVAAGPKNPLGDYALHLGIPGYLIHGTNRPYGIGMRVTHGCVRLYPRNIDALFHMVSVGTPVRIVNQPVKAGWLNGSLYVEVHPPFSGKSSETPVNLTPVVKAVMDATGQPPTDRMVDWDTVYAAARHTTGIPTKVSREPVASARTVSNLGQTD